MPTAPPPLAHALPAVALGGACGALLRYAASLTVPAHASAAAGSASPSIPWTVFAINVIGCLGMGLLTGALHRRPSASPLWRPFLGTGVLGGFTTFSAVAMDLTRLLERSPGTALAYAALTVATCLVATAAAFRLTVRPPAGTP